MYHARPCNLTRFSDFRKFGDFFGKYAHPLARWAFSGGHAKKFTIFGVTRNDLISSETPETGVNPRDGQNAGTLAKRV